MKNFKISTLVLILLCLITISSCKKDSIKLNSNARQMLNEKEYNVLKSHFKFKSLNSLDVSKKEIFKSLNNSNSNAKLSYKLDDLDLTTATQTIWEDDKVTYFIPFADNDKKFFVAVVNVNNEIDFERSFEIENLVDKDGNGKIITTFNDGESIREFVDGVEITNPNGKSRFRQCFDDAYDTICDGFWGCVAWYSNPTVPLLAAAYCA